MDIIAIYKCLCDRQRLRILNLLEKGPMCVCHMMEILDLEQVKVSKQLRYMKDLGMVKSERCAQWMVYSLSRDANPLLQENLRCLQDCLEEELCFKEDLQARERIVERINKEGSACLQSTVC